MAQEERNRLVEWLELLRDQLPVAREHARKWLVAVREDPRLIWQTPAVRYAIYGLAGLVFLWIGFGLADVMAPVPAAATKPQATSADFHVVCTRDRCGHHFVIHREFGFRKFPVVCPKCRQKTGVQACRCYSPACRGRWVAPVTAEGGRKCPHCGRNLP